MPKTTANQIKLPQHHPSCFHVVSLTENRVPEGNTTDFLCRHVMPSLKIHEMEFRKPRMS